MVPLSEYVSLQAELDSLREKVHNLERELKINSQQKQDIINTQSYSVNRSLVIKNNNVNRFIPKENVVMITAAGNYSYICLDSGEKILMSKTLKYWEKLLSDCELFRRVHKSYLINKNHVQGIESKTGRLSMSSGYIAFSSLKLKNLINYQQAMHTGVSNVIL